MKQALITVKSLIINKLIQKAQLPRYNEKETKFNVA